MILEHINKGTNMSKNLWDIEFDRVYKEILHEYIEADYNRDEAESLAKKEAKEVMKDELDFVSELYDNTLNDLD
tara:strand:+ start:155 stop:376 length:222 start_codon:yes stop_codon:yes gene_type:complete